MAFHDDRYTVTMPERVGEVHALLEGALWTTAEIRVHQGKTQLWNRVGENPRGWESLQRAVLAEDETAIVWRGSEELPAHQRGIKVLGTPLGHPDFVQAHLDKLTAQHQIHPGRWLLLVHCAAARANYIARVVAPLAAEQFCNTHDMGLWFCLCSILQIPVEQEADVRGAASMPLVLGGAGLRSALWVREPAHWSSWMDCLPTIHKRHPVVANQLVDELEGQPTTPFLSAAAEAVGNLTGTLGFDPPSWQAAMHGARPPPRNPEDFEPGTVRQGWQHEASSLVEAKFRETLFSRLSDQEQGLIRSQAGPGAGSALTALPTGSETTIPSHLFRIVLLRRLRQPLPLS